MVNVQIMVGVMSQVELALVMMDMMETSVKVNTFFTQQYVYLLNICKLENSYLQTTAVTTLTTIVLVMVGAQIKVGVTFVLELVIVMEDIKDLCAKVKTFFT